MGIFGTFPTAIYGVFLGLIALYWVLLVAGAVDLWSLDPADEGDSPDEQPPVITLFTSLGLPTVPLSLIGTVWLLGAWCTSAGLTALVDPSSPIVKIGIFVAASALGLGIAVGVLNPLGKSFTRPLRKKKGSLVGKTALASSRVVDTKSGQAVSGLGEEARTVEVRSATGNRFSAGTKLLLVDRDPNRGFYLAIEAPPDVSTEMTGAV